ncbi:hypothetical protein F4803DRAFT_549697 [Xylaria telfairii]|nr:hypothetical protein F4803DRAFT_549697 [Xylaria telfairii]
MATILFDRQPCRPWSHQLWLAGMMGVAILLSSTGARLLASIAFVYGSARTHQYVARAATQVPITSAANDVSQNQPDGSDGWAETHIYVFLPWFLGDLLGCVPKIAKWWVACRKPVKPAFVSDHPPLFDVLIDLASPFPSGYL